MNDRVFVKNASNSNVHNIMPKKTKPIVAIYTMLVPANSSITARKRQKMQ